MDKELYEKVKGYRTAVSVIKELLGRGLIDEGEYGVICTILAEKYGLRSSTIFSDIDLISAGTVGNIRH